MTVFETLAGIRILVLCSSFTTRAVVLKNRNFRSDSSLLSMVRARFVPQAGVQSIEAHYKPREDHHAVFGSVLAAPIGMSLTFPRNVTATLPAPGDQ